MDTCKKYTDRHLLAYLLNRMGEEERAEVQYHLYTCAACRERMKRIRAFSDFLEEPEEEQRAAVLPAAAVKKRLRFRGNSWRVVAAGVCLFLAVGGYYYWAASVGGKPDIFPLEIPRQPVYELIDTCRHVPDSLPVGQKKENEKK